MKKQFSMSMYAGRDDMHKAMVEYIRELEAKIEANDEKLVNLESELVKKKYQERKYYLTPEEFGEVCHNRAIDLAINLIHNVARHKNG